MNVPSENNPFDVLNTYDPKNQTLCVEKKGDKQILTAIDRKVADSRWNILIKLVGLGPLADKDTSVEGVQECIVKLFLSNEDNPLKTMNPKSKAYETTEKIAHYAANRGMYALENVMALKTLLNQENVKEIAEKEITFKNPEDRKAFIGLLKRRKDLREHIEIQKQDLAELEKLGIGEENPNQRPLDREEIQQRFELKKSKLLKMITESEDAQKKNEQAILVRRFGTEDAKQLTPDEVNLFFKHNQAADLFEKSGEQLIESLNELKRRGIQGIQKEVYWKDYRK